MVRIASQGHILALLTVALWGGTFVSTKVLLAGVSPAEILVLRFLIGYVALWAIRPKLLRTSGWREEALFAAAGICGVTLAFMLENTALTLTTASNVSVIVATSPLFTGLIMAYALKKGGLGAGFFVGFVLAIAGIVLISFSGESAAVAINPNGSDAMAMGLLGCLLALSNAIMCAIYSVLSQRASMGGHDSITVTRRFFFWGLVGMVPFLAFTGFDPDWGFLAQPIPLANLLFLGLGASAACYAMWNAALKRLGPVTTMAYQYLVPVITIAISVSVLGEPLTPAIVAGAVLTIAGLVVSQLKALLKGKKEPADRD